MLTRMASATLNKIKSTLGYANDNQIDSEPARVIETPAESTAVVMDRLASQSENKAASEDAAAIN